MLSEQIFKESLAYLCQNFNFQVSPEYIKIVYNSLKEKVSDTRMEKVTKNIIEKTTQVEWNKDFGFGGRPAVADWIDAYEIKSIKKTEYYKCSITGATLAREVWALPEQEIKKLEAK